MVPVNKIFNLFGRSPIRPLQKHMDKAMACAKGLLDFFAAVLNRDWALAEQHQHTIVALAQQAHDLKQDIRSHLPKSLFLPVPREDVLEILTMQDKLPQKAKDIAGLVLGRQMHLPDGIATLYIDLLGRAIDCVAQTDKAINEIDELLETGFRVDEITLIEELIHQISHIENETDHMQIQVRYELFKIEKTLEPIDAMFLYKVIELTGDLADRAEEIGDRLQLIIAR